MSLREPSQNSPSLASLWYGCRCWTKHSGRGQLEVAPVSDPEVWFAQVEAQFATRDITAKFNYIVASLSPEHATEVRDLLLHPPDVRPYDVFREQLIKRTAASEQRRLQQLLTSEELGDRKPSQLLRRMQQLLGGRTDSPFVRELFLQHLPASVRMVLASSADGTTLEDIAQLADHILEKFRPRLSQVSPATHRRAWNNYVRRSAT